jgi:predicted GNAT family acetyltransferase
MDRPDIEIVDNPTARRYEARMIGTGTVAGFSEYELDGDRIRFLHTEVDPSLEGQGIGSRLAAGALAAARSRDLRVIAKCPFIASYARRHAAEYADLVTTVDA